MLNSLSHVLPLAGDGTGFAGLAVLRFIGEAVRDGAWLDTLDGILGGN